MINTKQSRDGRRLNYLDELTRDFTRLLCKLKLDRRALSIRVNILARRCVRCLIPVEIPLFKATYCTSFYTSSLWGSYIQRLYKALLCVRYNNAFRVLLGLPRYCSVSSMFAHAGVDIRCTLWVDSFPAIRSKKESSI